jgi:hypothetical protein
MDLFHGLLALVFIMDIKNAVGSGARCGLDYSNQAARSEIPDRMKELE